MQCDQPPHNPLAVASSPWWTVSFLKLWTKTNPSSDWVTLWQIFGHSNKRMNTLVFMWHWTPRIPCFLPVNLLFTVSHCLQFCCLPCLLVQAYSLSVWSLLTAWMLLSLGLWLPHLLFPSLCCSRSPFLWLRLFPLLLPPSGCSPFTKQRKSLVYLMPSSLPGAFPHSAVTRFSAFTSLLPFLYSFCVLLLLAGAWRHFSLSHFPTVMSSPLTLGTLCWSYLTVIPSFFPSWAAHRMNTSCIFSLNCDLYKAKGSTAFTSGCPGTADCIDKHTCPHQ